MRYLLAVPDDGPRLCMVDVALEPTDEPVPAQIAEAYRRGKQAGLVPGSVGLICLPGARWEAVRWFDFGEMEATRDVSRPVDVDRLFTCSNLMSDWVSRPGA